MFGPMNSMTERSRINNERQLNEARMISYTLPKSSRFAALMQKLTLRRPAMSRSAAPTLGQPLTKRA